MALRNSLIALLAAVLLIVVVVSSVGRRTTSEVDKEPRSAPQAGGPAVALIAPPAVTSIVTPATNDASGMAPGGSTEPAGAAGQDLLPPDYGDPAATDLYPTSALRELPDQAGARSSTDPYPTSFGLEDLAPGDATPAADPFPTSLPENQPDRRDAASPPGDASPPLPTAAESAAGLPDTRAPTDPTQQPQVTHPTEEQLSPTP